jgi:threonine dehydratase
MLDSRLIDNASARLALHVVRTPLLHAPQLSDELGCRVWLKCENFQHTGSFKARGATNAVLALDDATAQRGVLTHSSGNHAAALARAAWLRKIPAYVVMPENASPVKRANAERYGAVIRTSGPRAEEREQMANDWLAETDAHLVPPFDDERVIAGQATVAREILHQLSTVHAIIAPVGGGGLLAGVIAAVQASTAPVPSRVQVYGAEPEWADDLARSLQAGTRQPALRHDTVADGVRVPVGQVTFPIIQQGLTDVLLASEQAIVAAMQRLAFVEKLVAEPSGALSVASLIAHRKRFQDQDVAVIISGGNVSLAQLASAAS